MSLLSYLRDNYNGYTDSERIIADYLLSANSDSILGLSSKELGKITGTSASTVVRFAQKLGFSSFNELKLKLSINLNDKESKSNITFEYLDENLTTKDIMLGIKSNIITAVYKTITLIKEESLDVAIDLLRKSKHIYIYGVGSSALVGLDLYYKLSRINKRATVNIDTHLQIASSVILQPGDVVLAISYSGETKEILKCVSNAKKLNVPIIAITKASINNKLSQIATVTLPIPPMEKKVREGAMSSRITQLAIIDMLFVGISKYNINEIESDLLKTSEAIKEFTNE